MVHPNGDSRMGSPAVDVSELEYISALLQSESADIPLRPDGTLVAIDIRRLLVSRHGLRIPVHRIEQELFQQLAGSSSSTDAGKIVNEEDNFRSRRDGESSINAWLTTDNENAIAAESKTSILHSSIEVTTNMAANVVKSLLPKSTHGSSSSNSNLNNDHHQMCLDLVQLAALLFIPELQRFRLELSETILDDDKNDDDDDDTDSANQRTSHQRRPWTRKNPTGTPQHRKKKNDFGTTIDAALKIFVSLSGMEAAAGNDDSTTNNNPESNITNHSNYNIELTTSVIREILVALEEDDDVSEELLHEMLYVAATGNIAPLSVSNISGGSPTSATVLPSEIVEPVVVLNRETFLNALTADIAVAIETNVLPYENRPTTHYEDATRKVTYNNDTASSTQMLSLPVIPDEDNDIAAAEKTDRNSNNNNQTRWFSKMMKTTRATAHTIHETTTIVAKDTTLNDPDLYRMWTAPSIDMVADTYKSFWWTVVMWFTLVILFFSYFVSANLYSVNSRLPSIDCTTAERISTFACKCMQGVVIWLNIFVQLAVLGTSFILLSSFGNTIYRYKSKMIAIVMCLLGIIVTSFTTILAYRYSVNTALFSTEKDSSKIGGRYVYAASLVLGCILLLIQVANILRMLISTDSLTVLSWLPIFAASSRKLERNTKCAAAFKMQRMMNNALVCHAIQDVDVLLDTPSNCLIVESGNDSDEKADVLQATAVSKNSIISNIVADDWQGSLSDTLYNYEVESHRTSDPSALAVLPIWRELWYTRKIGCMDGIWIHPRLVASNLSQWSVFVLIPVICIFGFTLAENNSDFLETRNVKVWEVKVGISVGAVLSMLSIFYLAVVYIPSAIATVMGFRCGSIGSLKDKQFPVHRYAQDETTILYGTAFWGAIFTCVLLWVLTGLVAFVVVWSEAQSFVQTVLATIIGFLITLLLKLLILQILRKSWYGAFYRRKPAAANIMNIMLECWSFGLSSGYVIARVVKLLLVSLFYIGRIDTPFLAPGVSWLFNRIPIDTFPIAFRKDLLSHEAHRHPYIERLSMLFMLKLHNGPNFGCRACALWRILFVRTLMPWLRKYRRRAVVALDGGSSHDLSTSRKYRSTSSHVELTSTRKKRALEMENYELRRENISLRQQLLRQNSLYRRKSVLQLEQQKSECNGSDSDEFYDTTNA